MVKANRSQRTAEAGLYLAGMAFEQLGLAFRVQRENDFGIDAHVELIVDDSATGRLVAVQVKSGPSYLVEQSEASYVFRADSGHVQYWLNHSLPVIVCICDMDNNVVYWQSIAQDTAISTGDGFKFMVPKHQTVSAPSLAALTHIFTPVVSHDKYTILRTSDQSHALAKRYSFHVVLNGTFTKREVASIVPQLTIDGAKRRYYRNNLTERTWGDSDAHVIWTFIYPSVQDHANNNLFCRSLWISPTLEEQWRPTSMEGENVGDGIIVDWNSQYELVADLFSGNQANKEEFMRRIPRLVEQLKAQIQQLAPQLSDLASNHVSVIAFRKASRGARENVSVIYSEVVALPAPPYECRVVHQLLQSAAASADNVSVLYAENVSRNWSEKNRLMQAMEQCGVAESGLRDLEYALDKVR